ncbi:MAG: PGF-pre-PGF domain-containing protein [Methanomicrobia archaeon]|nr:PGF-pre-PGF domain-containing protein [Methanomicrobia archaeon]
MYNYTSRMGLHQQIIHERYFTTLDGNGNAMSSVIFTWTSSNENIGTVNDTGLFEAFTSGTATISAAHGSVTGTATVTVVDGGGDGDGGDGGSSGGSSAKVTPTPTPTPTQTAPTVTKASRSVPVLNAGEEVAMVFEGMDVSLLTLKADTTVNEVTVTVERVEKAVDIPEPSGIAYAYLDITLENAESTSIEGTVEFKVAKSWVIDNDINDTTITLSQYNEGNGWTTLATSNVWEDNTSVFLEAEIPHFSLFAITGEKKEKNETATPSLASSPTTTSTQTPVATPTAPPSPHEGTPTPDADETLLSGFDILFAVCGLLVVVYTVKRRKK